MTRPKDNPAFSSEGLGEELFDLERARQREKQLRVEAEGLLEGLRALTNAVDTHQLFEKLVDVLRRFIPFEDAIMLESTAPGLLESVYTTSPVFRGLRWTVGSMFRRVLDGQTVAVFDAHSIPDWSGQPLEVGARVRSAIHTPLQTGTRSAILIFVHARPAMFNKVQVRLLERFAPLTNQALAAIEYRESLVREQCLVAIVNDAANREIIERRLTEQKLVRLNRLYAALSASGAARSRQKDAGALFREICRICVDHGGLAAATIGMLDPASGTILSVAYYPDTYAMHGACQSTVVDASLIASVIRQARHEIYNEYLSGSPALTRSALGQQSAAAAAAFPLREAGRVVGALELHAPEPGFFDEEIVNLILQIAEDVSFALGSFVQERMRLKAENALRANEEKLRGLFELAPLGIALVDMQGNYIEFNEAFRSICGYPADELKTLDYWKLTPKKYEAEEAKQLESLRQTGRYGPYEKQYIRKDGSLVDLLLNGMLISLSDGQTYIWSIVEDTTKRKQMEADLRIAATAFEAQVGIVVMDAERKILRINRAFTGISGYSAEDVVGKLPYMFRSSRHDDAFFTALWDSVLRIGTWQGEVWGRRKCGEIFPGWMIITAVKGEDGVATHYVSTQIDITENKAAEEEIRHLAFYDALTKLPNRRLLLDRLQQAMAVSTRSGRAGALLFIDLDHFKTLNDTLGHDKGDLLLEQVAKRLVSCVRESDTVARLGGDEFVIMQEGLSDSLPEAAAQARTLGEKLLAAFSQSFQMEGYEHFSTASIGIALFQDHRDQVSDLLKRADLAMYQAKAAGRNALRFFDPDMQAVVNTRAALEADLRHALQRRQFLLHYQPQVDADGRMTGAEALVRWQHPSRGLVSPLEFIPVAEDSGQILPLGLWVLETACGQLLEWGNSPESSRLEMAVNISARQFYHPDFVEQVLATLARTGANPNRLKLELTESVLLTNFEDIIGKMSLLKARGISFSLDDFGTGYSSLSYLKRLPLDQLKIDQSFVRDILTDPNDASIAKTIVALGHSLGLSVIAEGVETEEQLTFLAVNGCNAYQGFLFSQPLSADRLELFVALNC